MNCRHSAYWEYGPAIRQPETLFGHWQIFCRKRSDYSNFVNLFKFKLNIFIIFEYELPSLCLLRIWSSYKTNPKHYLDIGKYFAVNEVIIRICKLRSLSWFGRGNEGLCFFRKFKLNMFQFLNMNRRHSAYCEKWWSTMSAGSGVEG